MSQRKKNQNSVWNVQNSKGGTKKNTKIKHLTPDFSRSKFIFDHLMTDLWVTNPTTKPKIIKAGEDFFYLQTSNKIHKQKHY